MASTILFLAVARTAGEVGTSLPTRDRFSPRDDREGGGVPTAGHPRHRASHLSVRSLPDLLPEDVVPHERAPPGAPGTDSKTQSAVGARQRWTSE